MLVERWRLTSVNEELVGDARMIDIMYRTGKYGSKNFKVCKHSLKTTDTDRFSKISHHYPLSLIPNNQKKWHSRSTAYWDSRIVPQGQGLIAGREWTV